MREQGTFRKRAIGCDRRETSKLQKGLDVTSVTPFIYDIKEMLLPLPIIQTYCMYPSIYCITCSYLSICTCVPRTEWIAGVVSGYMFLCRFFYLTSPGSLHAVGRHQYPAVFQRVITQVLVLWGVHERHAVRQNNSITQRFSKWEAGQTVSGRGSVNGVKNIRLVIKRRSHTKKLLTFWHWWYLWLINRDACFLIYSLLL